MLIKRSTGTALVDSQKISRIKRKSIRIEKKRERMRRGWKGRREEKKKKAAQENFFFSAAGNFLCFSLPSPPTVNGIYISGYLGSIAFDWPISIYLSIPPTDFFFFYIKTC